MTQARSPDHWGTELGIECGARLDIIYALGGDALRSVQGSGFLGGTDALMAGLLDAHLSIADLIGRAWHARRGALDWGRRGGGAPPRDR